MILLDPADLAHVLNLLRAARTNPDVEDAAQTLLRAAMLTENELERYERDG